MKRGAIIPKILEILQLQAEATADILNIFFTNYKGSYHHSSEPTRFKNNWSEKYLEKQTFYSLLNKLKNQGLIEKDKSSGKSFWHITKKGLEKIKRKKENKLSRNFGYKKESDKKLKVIIFDVPEKQREKRDWLRAALFSLGFSLLQQSVWIGKKKIPEKFLKDLKEKEILPFVYIFNVHQEGSIGEY